MRRFTFSLLVAAISLVAVLLAGPITVSADAIGPPSPDCPSGAVGQSTHYGPHCAPDRCEADAACAPGSSGARPAGRTCGEASFCVHEQLNESPRGDTFVATLLGPCAADGSCARGECQAGRYCLAPESTPTPDPTPEPAPDPAPEPTPESTPDGGGCSVGHGAFGGLGVSLLVLLSGLLYTRARRRS